MYSDALRYSFMRLLQEELHSIMKEWNSYRIRPSAHAETPGGVPDMLYLMPELYGMLFHGYSTLYHRITFC